VEREDGLRLRLHALHDGRHDRPRADVEQREREQEREVEAHGERVDAEPRVDEARDERREGHADAEQEPAPTAAGRPRELVAEATEPPLAEPAEQLVVAVAQHLRQQERRDGEEEREERRRDEEHAALRGRRHGVEDGAQVGDRRRVVDVGAARGAALEDGEERAEAPRGVGGVARVVEPRGAVAADEDEVDLAVALTGGERRDVDGHLLAVLVRLGDRPARREEGVRLGEERRERVVEVGVDRDPLGSGGEEDEHARHVVARDMRGEGRRQVRGVLHVNIAGERELGARGIDRRRGGGGCGRGGSRSEEEARGDGGGGRHASEDVSGHGENLVVVRCFSCSRASTVSRPSAPRRGSCRDASPATSAPAAARRRCAPRTRPRRRGSG